MVVILITFKSIIDFLEIVQGLLISSIFSSSASYSSPTCQVIVLPLLNLHMFTQFTAPLNYLLQSFCKFLRT